MAEEISYYWEIDGFGEGGGPLRERLVLVEWMPEGSRSDETAEAVPDRKVRVERIADFRTVDFFKVYLNNDALPQITFEEVAEENGAVVRRDKRVVSGATIPVMEQRDRLAGEHEWATRPYIDEFVLQL